MVIDAINQHINLSATQIKALSRADTGVGFDQCLLVEPSHEADVDFFYRIFNADGSEAGQCGNGARCLARFLQHTGLSRKPNITVTTSTTRMRLRVNEDDSVTVDMGIPRWQPAQIPLHMPKQQISYQLPLKNGEAALVHALSIGNPHAVSLVTDVAHAPVTTLGQEISEHILFPEQVNAGFMQIINPEHLRLRVYERGCGETQACGSGAVAAAAVGRACYGMSEKIYVELPGGKLLIEWPDTQGSIFLTGPATFIYEGLLL